MKCLDCQHALIKIPTSQGPDLDVCSNGHGLWLDAGEVNLFVEDYAALERDAGPECSAAVCTEALCPRCGKPMESESFSATTFLSCQSCQGWWLPHGSLTSLNRSYRGGAVSILVQEADWYTRAAAREFVLKTSSRPRPKIEQARRARQNVWFWAVFFAIALMIGVIVLSAGIPKTAPTTRWSHPADQALMYLVLGVVAGLGLSIYGSILIHRKRMIENIPTSTVRSLALGLVEISGRAQPEVDLLTSPFGGLPCVFYSYAVEEQIGYDKNKRWETIAQGTSEQPFFVNDGTGRVLVVPFGAELILPDEHSFGNGLLGELPAGTIDGLKRLGISPDGWGGDRKLRCRENFILPEQEIYVLGTALEHHGAGGLVDNASRMYIGCSQDHAFLISDRSEKELLSRLRWQILGCVAGGLTLAVGSIIVIAVRYLSTGS